MLQSDFSGSSSTLSCINHHHIPLRSFSLTQYKCSCIYTPESTQTVNSYLELVRIRYLADCNKQKLLTQTQAQPLTSPTHGRQRIR